MIDNTVLNYFIIHLLTVSGSIRYMSEQSYTLVEDFIDGCNDEGQSIYHSSCVTYSFLSGHKLHREGLALYPKCLVLCII